MRPNHASSKIPEQTGVAKLWPIYRGLQWMPVLAAFNMLIGLLIYFLEDGATLRGLIDWLGSNMWLAVMGSGILLLALYPIYWQLRKRDLLIRELLAELESRGVIGNTK